MCSRHVANVSRMVIQSIFTGTQGSGSHTTHTLTHTYTHAHTHAIQHHCVDFTFVRQGFGLWHPNADTHHLTASTCVCVYTWTSDLCVCLHVDLSLPFSSRH